MAAGIDANIPKLWKGKKKREKKLNYFFENGFGVLVIFMYVWYVSLDNVFFILFLLCPHCVACINGK